MVDLSAAKDQYDVAVARRRADLICIYDSLPPYASKEFWETIERENIPLEVLVRCLRNCSDIKGRNRIVEIIICRTQTSNKQWANSVLKDVSLLGDERYALVCDLCADLYESMIRAFVDSKRLFWEENFLHCLFFERKHVYQAFMRREGRWKNEHAKKTTRVPRTLLASLDQPIRLSNGETLLLDIEDEQALMMRSLEHNDLLRRVLQLPEQLKMVVFLIFWEGRSEKDAARVLGVTDRTVRNRMRKALLLLREELNLESEDGKR